MHDVDVNPRAMNLRMWWRLRTAAEQRGDNFQRLRDFHLKASARIWPRLSYMCNILGGVPREQNMLKGHLPRVIHHQVYEDYPLERLRENLADSTRNIFRNLHQNRLDGPVACHVLVQNSRFRKCLSLKSAKSSRDHSTITISWDGLNANDYWDSYTIWRLTPVKVGNS